MKTSIDKIKKLIADMDFETVIKDLSKVVKSDDANFEEYFYFVEAVSSFCDKTNYPQAYQCFVKANLSKEKNDELLKRMYELIIPIIQSLGFAYFNDKNTHNINRELFLQARFMLFVHATKYTDAYMTISKLIEEFPTAANYAQRSKIDVLQKKYKIALKDIDNAIKINPEHSEFYYNRALLKQKLNDGNGALADFDSAINLNSERTDYYFSRGLLEESMEKFKNATDDFKKVLQMQPANTKAFMELAWCCYKQNKYKEAYVFANMAIKTDENNAGCYYVRGTVFNKVRMYKEARTDLEKAVNLDNCSDKLWSSKIKYQKARAEFLLKNFSQAEKDISDAIKYYSRSISYYILAMDIAFFGLQNYLSAKNYCQEILKIDAENQRALAAKAVISEKIANM